MKPKHIGIIAVTAPGAALCYQAIVSESEKILGTKHHPSISLFHPPFYETYEAHQRRDWKTVEKILLDSIRRVALSGADFVIMPANATHYAHAAVAKKSPIPFLSLVDITVQEARRRRFKKAAILGVDITMTDGLYVKPLEGVGIEPFTPPRKDQEVIKDIIHTELITNKPTPQGTQKLIALLRTYQSAGCDVALLACTELPIVLNADNSPIPVIDTTRLLATKAVEISLAGLE